MLESTPPESHNQSEQVKNLMVSPALVAGSSAPRACANSERTQWRPSAEQPSNEKTTAYRTNRSEQKKTNEEKQAKKKELDRAMLQGGAFKASWTAPELEGKDLEVALVQIFKLFFNSFLNPTNCSFNRAVHAQKTSNVAELKQFCKVGQNSSTAT